MKLKKLLKHLDPISYIKVLTIDEKELFTGDTFDVPKRYKNLRVHKADGDGEIFVDTSGRVITWLVYVDI